jgi:hypothetical protein
MSEPNPSDFSNVLSEINEGLQRLEARLGQHDVFYHQITYLFGTVAAMDFVLKRMMASHAETMPYGVISRFLIEEETVLASISALPDLPEEQRQVMTFHLKMMLKDVRKFLEKTQNTPPQAGTSTPN